MGLYKQEMNEEAANKELIRDMAQILEGCKIALESGCETESDEQGLIMGIEMCLIRARMRVAA
jgi:molecular chaperone GrpE (heat shock protein)